MTLQLSTSLRPILGRSDKFLTTEKKFFLESYQRSGQYRPMIVRMLRDSGLPEELSWLPLVESGFKTRALSRARALGMWQFVSGTARLYGMKVGANYDERMQDVHRPYYDGLGDQALLEIDDIDEFVTSQQIDIHVPVGATAGPVVVSVDQAAELLEATRDPLEIALQSRFAGFQ